MKAIIVALALCGGLLAHAQAPASRPKAAASRTGAAATRPSLLNPASLHAHAPAVFKAKFTTTAGDIIIEVHRDWAPLGADRFYNLVRRGFFTNASFFRVVPGFVVQFGLNADPAVNNAWKDADIQDDPVVQSNKRGSLVFATAGPNTRTTQFFINYADNARLDAMGFAPFGTVIEGMDVVDKIYPGYGEQPQQPLITQQGDPYISRNFPRIDKIKSALIVPPAPAAKSANPAHKPLAGKINPQ
jgi:peptidyl-prolyl cis-trans isomerase A (cyclophilin A)